MDNTWIGFTVVVLTVVASHARLHRDIADLRERMTRLEIQMTERIGRLEGIVEGFIAAQKTG